MYMCVCVYMLMCVENKCPYEFSFRNIKYKRLCVTKKCDTLVNLNENSSSNMFIFVVYQEV